MTTIDVTSRFTLGSERQPLTIDRIRRFPTTIESGNMHESLLRAYQILERVKWLLENGCSPAVVLQEIAEMEEVTR